MERTGVREREPSPEARDYYEEVLAWDRANKERTLTGQLLIKGKDQPWESNRQGIIKWYTHPNFTNTALNQWRVFAHDIRTKSGKHIHQGGLAIYVLEGRGYTTVNSERVDWEKGDLLLLPVLAGGVEHQHFNLDPEKPAVWLAMLYEPFHVAMGSEIEQVEVSPEYAG